MITFCAEPSTHATSSGPIVMRNDPECPNCGPDAELIEDFKAGDLICDSCGTVVGDRVVDVRSEWRTFSGSGDKDTIDPNRVAADQNPLLEHLGLSTAIGYGKKGGTGGSESRGLNKLNRVAVSQNDRTLLNGFKLLGQLADRISLPLLIVHRAQNIFSNEEVQKFIRGRPVEAMAVACLYLACRWEKVPRTFKEIMSLTSCTQKQVRKNYKKLISVVDVGSNVQTITTDDFMSRFCSNLKLPMAIQNLSSKVAQNASESDCVAGKSPISIAAAAIYMVTLISDEKRACKDIAAVSGVSESTIKVCFKEMYPQRFKLFPENSPLFSRLDAMSTS